MGGQTVGVCNVLGCVVWYVCVRLFQMMKVNVVIFIKLNFHDYVDSKMRCILQESLQIVFFFGITYSVSVLLYVLVYFLILKPDCY